MGRSMLLLTAAWLYSVTFCVGTGVIPAWGRWYSPDLHYRSQTDAFFRGELSLAADPSMIDHDLVWSGSGVHQVWGLGVPAWRWVFEVLARWVWQADFPDSLCFMVALGIWGWWVLSTLSRMIERIVKKPCLIASGGYLVLTLLTLFNPCLVSMCSTRFAVYEEACAYAYLYGVGLMLAVAEMELAPSHRKLAWIALLAGLGPLVRPTLVFQGLGAMGVGLWIGRSSACTTGGWASRWGVPGMVYSGGVLLLLVTNRIRFGSALEFGHSLNFQVLFGSMYATRFDHPFGEETLWDALAELLGAMFRVLDLNGDDYYAEGVLGAQSRILRWREFYFTTFDIGWPLLWVVALALGCRFGRGIGEPDGLMRGVAVVAISSCFALCGFYLRTPVISSRYICDFAPAFTAFTWLSVLGITRFLVSVRPRVGGTGVALLLGWWCSLIGRVEGDSESPTAFSCTVPGGEAKADSFRSGGVSGGVPGRQC